MEAGVHLPQLDVDGTGLNPRRLLEVVNAARECGFEAVSANDHFVYGRPWLDGPTALAMAVEQAGQMDLMTSVALPVLRGPVPLASAVATLDAMARGRVILGVAPGSSRADYEALGVPFEERWERFDESVTVLRALVSGGPEPSPGRHYSMPAGWLRAEGQFASRIPLWIGSWGSRRGLERVSRSDGWLASAYNIDPDGFAAGLAALTRLRPETGSPAGVFPHAVVTMWTWVTNSSAEIDRKLAEVADLVHRDRRGLTGRLCVGSAEMCVDLLSRYAEAGCRRVHFWPLGDERRQIERLAGEVLVQVNSGKSSPRERP